MNTFKRILCLFTALLVMLPWGSLAAYGSGPQIYEEHTADCSYGDYALLCAEYLNSVNLMQGAGTNADGSVNYALDRPLTRVEAVVMMIRLLGKEDEALRCTEGHPFNDVPSWAMPYIAYAYRSGLTDGVSPDRFGTGTASAAMYTTYLLRAMGYSDARGDFSWDDPFELAEASGIELEGVSTEAFLRSDAAVLSRNSLFGTDRAGSRLYQRLIDDGVFSEEDLHRAEEELAQSLDDAGAYGQDSALTEDTEHIKAEKEEPKPGSADSKAFDFSMVPEYSGKASVSINGGDPFFEENDLSTQAFEYYSPLDSLGRCGTAYANICKEIMPTEKRGSIGMVKPSGWQISKYDFIPNQYLYNRCHLIGYQLSGENANTCNLVTGTFYMNTEGMNPYENRVAGYVDRTGNHVLYRVTPIFAGKELVCRGVLMEGLSVEDGGAGIHFCVFAYNVQPKIAIDYATGENQLLPEDKNAATPGEDGERSPRDTDTREPSPCDPCDTCDFVLNTRSGVYHYPGCPSIDLMAEHNKSYYSGSADEVEAMHYRLCGNCRNRLGLE